jgi:hypothetical protein
MGLFSSIRVRKTWSGDLKELARKATTFCGIPRFYWSQVEGLMCTSWWSAQVIHVIRVVPAEACVRTCAGNRTCAVCITFAGAWLVTRNSRSRLFS